MDNNPWQVNGIEDFSYFHCPECTFVAKEKRLFQDHALEKHPLSFGLFGKKLEEIYIANIIKVEMCDTDEVAELDFDDTKISEMKKSLESVESSTEKSKEYQSDLNDTTDPLAFDHTLSIKTESQSFIITDFPDQSKTNLNSVPHLEDANLFKKSKANIICKQCGDKFEDRRELKGHILSVHKEKELYRCSTCHVWKTAIISMKRHIVSDHDKDKTLMNYKPKELLKMNIFHKIEKSETCDQCGEKFDNKRELKGHTLSVHKEKKVYRCTICKACFVEPRNLKRHVVSAHGKKNFSG